MCLHPQVQLMHILKFKFEVNSVQRSSDFHYIQLHMLQSKWRNVITHKSKETRAHSHAPPPHYFVKCNEFRDGMGLRISNSIFLPMFFSINGYDRPSLNLLLLFSI